MTEILLFELPRKKTMYYLRVWVLLLLLLVPLLFLVVWIKLVVVHKRRGWPLLLSACTAGWTHGFFGPNLGQGR